MTATHRRRSDVVVAAVGVVLHAAVLAIISVSTLLAPPWAAVTGAGVWVSSLVPLVYAVRLRPALAPLVPLAVLVTWVAFVTFGDLVLGWTA